MSDLSPRRWWSPAIPPNVSPELLNKVFRLFYYVEKAFEDGGVELCERLAQLLDTFLGLETRAARVRAALGHVRHLLEVARVKPLGLDLAAMGAVGQLELLDPRFGALRWPALAALAAETVARRGGAKGKPGRADKAAPAFLRDLVVQVGAFDLECSEAAESAIESVLRLDRKKKGRTADRR